MSEYTGQNLPQDRRERFNFASWMIVYLVTALFVFLSLTRSSFFTFSNIHSIFHSVSFNYYAAIGFTLLIIMGELDLSVGSMFGFGGAMMGLFIFTYKLPAPAAITLAMASAALVGLCAGFLIVKFRLNSMMVTVGVMIAVRGVNWMLVNMFSGRQFPVSARRFISVDIMGVRWTILLMIATALVLEILLAKSRHLKQLYYIGHNTETTILYGLNAGMVKCVCFAISAAMSAFGGTLMTARLAHPNVTVGANLEINIITAAVISGASIFGGRGSVIRTMLGVTFVFTLQNGMTSYNINTYVQQIILGAILILAIYLDTRANADGSR
ncbi:MAG: ABC transporter permease [Synergistaceae bacterium]|nr:ABC transporter permease [Synergistaceae bacterium]